MIARHSPTETATGPQQNLVDTIDRRIAELRSWLQENAPECANAQNHLDANTSERGYWHHGYLVALIDIRRMLENENGNDNGNDHPG